MNELIVKKEAKLRYLFLKRLDQDLSEHLFDKAIWQNISCFCEKCSRKPDAICGVDWDLKSWVACKETLNFWKDLSKRIKKEYKPILTIYVIIRKLKKRAKNKKLNIR